MTPMAFPLGPTELIIILVIVVLLFGGSRLAGLGKSTGRALKEFKEETSGLRGKSDEEKAPRRRSRAPMRARRPSLRPIGLSALSPSRPTANFAKTPDQALLTWRCRLKWRPARFNLNWLKPPKPEAADGSMTLFEHLAELRYRLVICVLAILAHRSCLCLQSTVDRALITQPYHHGE